MTVLREDCTELPPTREACRARLVELQNDVAAIKTQIAAADLERQERRRAVDPRWFHRAKTALRHKQREIAELQVHMSSLPSPRDAFKDCLIEVLRSDYDDARWSSALDAAHALHRQREAR